MTRHPGSASEDTAPFPPVHEAPRTAVVDGTAPGGTPSPVFVDASGRRQRRVRRFGRLLVVPAAVYVVLLVSTLLGGPTVRSPFLPSAQAPQPVQASTPASAPSATSGPGDTEAGAAQAGTPTRRAPASSGAASNPPGKATTTPPPATGPTPSATTGDSSSPAPTAPGGGHGKSTSAPGQSSKPTRP